MKIWVWIFAIVISLTGMVCSYQMHNYELACFAGFIVGYFLCCLRVEIAKLIEEKIGLDI